MENDSVAVLPWRLEQVGSGHGCSMETGRGYQFEALADDLNGLIERLDLRGVTLVGRSMGCGEIVPYL